MILRSTDVRSAKRAKQRGFIIDPFKFGAAGPAGGSHRYWGLKDFVVSGSTMELSEIQFLAAGVIVAATMTTNTGSNGALIVDNSLSTSNYWPTASAVTHTFDFKAAHAIDNVRIGSFDTSSRHPTGFTLQYSDDNSSWTTAHTVSGNTYPGANTYNSVFSFTAVGSHRYWRCNSWTTSGGDLEFSELQLRVGSDNPFLRTADSTDVPSSGSLSNLIDANFNTLATWTDTVAEAGGFRVWVDFKAAVTVTQFALGSGATSATFPTQATMQSSDDASSWAHQGNVTGISFPGNNMVSTTYTPA